MAASKSNFTLLHGSLIFFVMATIILGVTTYLGYKERGEALAVEAKARQDADAKNRTNVQYAEEIRALKEAIGHTDSEVGTNDPTNANSVLYKAQGDLEQFGGPGLAAGNYRDTLIRLRQELDRALGEVKSLTDKINDLNATNASLLTSYQGMASQHDDRKNQALQELAARVKSHQEELDAKIAEVTSIEAELQRVKTERDQLVKEYGDQIEKKNEAIENYRRQVVLLDEELQRVRKVSFEQPDGVIRTVDSSRGLVYINRGSNDYLPERTTFSVYSKAHHGVGRGQEYIKGAIEVTRIIGPDLAEARILRDTLADPISAGDPIFTPLWTPGRQERVAFVGRIDIDGDGYSDRETIFNRVRNTGADIVSWVDDEGVRHGGKLDIKTRYLVIGELDPKDASDPDSVKVAQDVAKHHGEMIEEARQHGVSVITLHDFAAQFGGDVLRNRTWRPGEPYPRTLKSGAASTAVNETIGDRSSAGTTSGVYGRRGQVEQPVSPGQTSKLFGGGRP